MKSTSYKREGSTNSKESLQHDSSAKEDNPYTDPNEESKKNIKQTKISENLGQVNMSFQPLHAEESSCGTTTNESIHGQSKSAKQLNETPLSNTELLASAHQPTSISASSTENLLIKVIQYYNPHCSQPVTTFPSFLLPYLWIITTCLFPYSMWEYTNHERKLWKRKHLIVHKKSEYTLFRLMFGVIMLFLQFGLNHGNKERSFFSSSPAQESHTSASPVSYDLFLTELSKTMPSTFDQVCTDAEKCWYCSFTIICWVFIHGILRISGFSMLK